MNCNKINKKSEKPDTTRNLYPLPISPPLDFIEFENKIYPLFVVAGING